MSHPYPLTETDVLIGESLDITSSSRYPSSQQTRQEKPKAGQGREDRVDGFTPNDLTHFIN